MFAVNSRPANRNNFALNLNGYATGASGTSARFSLHLPWGNGILYFDAGGCCTTTRLSFIYPVPLNVAAQVTLGNSINGYSGIAGVNQFIRLDGTTRASDGSAVSPTVTGGIHLGSTATYNTYQGRFSEVLVYDGALSLTEIQDVECYLANKWDLPLPTGCVPRLPVSLSVNKSSSSYNGGSGTGFEVPGGELIYSIGVSCVSGDSFDADSMLLVDQLPDQLEFFNGDLDASSGPFTHPVGFTNSGSYIDWDYGTSFGYSNGASAPTDASQCNYTPAAGYDPNVKFICIFPRGFLNSGQADFRYRVRVK